MKGFESRCRRHAAWRPWVAVFAAPFVASLPLAGADLEARLADQKGAPIEDGVVVAVSLDGGAPASPASRAIMDQIDEAFVPQVLPVPVGTAVTFPNKDDIRHHVYSFSEAKKFELPLYKGEPAAPVVFDTPGEVVLGCNIHDHMRGYLLVVDSPFFAKTNQDGSARLEGLATGTYEIRIWHPRQKKDMPPRKVEVTDAGAALDFQVDLKPALRLRGSSARGKKY